MNALFAAALEIQQTMREKSWPFCFIGGLAVMRWGEIRMTQDIDLCLLCGFGNEKDYVQELLRRYDARTDDPETFAGANRVLLLRASNNVPVDISLSGLKFEEEMIRRATPFSFDPDATLITCSAEDLIVLKAFAERPKDWSDIESIRETSRRVNRDVKAVHGDVTALLNAGLLIRNDKGAIEFPYDAVKVEFLLHAA